MKICPVQVSQKKTAVVAAAAATAVTRMIATSDTH